MNWKFAVLLPLALVSIAPGAMAQGSDRAAEGIRLFEAGRHAEAREVLEAVHRADQSDHQAAYYLGRIAYAGEDWGKASDWFGKAVKVEEDNALYHLWQGRAYGAQAQRANVLRQAVLARRTRGAFERAVALDPSNAEARFDLMSYYLVAPGAVGGSKEKAREQALEIRNLNDWLGFVAWTQIYRQDGDAAALVQESHAWIQAFPDSAQPYLGLGVHLQQTGEYLQAIDIFEEFLSRRAGEASVLYQIGRAAALSGERLERGQAALEEYLQIAEPQDPMRVGAHWRLGMIHEHQGRPDLARQQYEAALAVDPKHKESREALKKLQ